MVGQKLGVDGGVCRCVMKELHLPEEVLLPVDEFLLASAAVNELGYPLHLTALERMLGLRGSNIEVRDKSGPRPAPYPKRS
jgi:hypothetical protein